MFYFSTYIFLITILSIPGCRGDRSKKELLWTNTICDKLHTETYLIIGGGAGGGDRVSQYLTDSSSFRIYIGTFVQGYGFYSYKCSGDSITVYKSLTENGKSIVENQKIYLLSDLKKKKIVE